MSKHIVLEGFMGSGKTTVGIRLSYKMSMTVEDTDKLIEREQQKKISDIFAQEGEEAFRRMETECLKNLAKQGRGQIISLGGGVPMRAENREILKTLGIVVYLRAKPETVYERVKNDTSRPLLQCEDPLSRIRELMEARAGMYEEAADVVIDTDELSVEQILTRIVREAEKRGIQPCSY
ncbi:MAG: shikimate kinase [Clostridium sp.]|nr:shikimate kinase [Clostridium sp.]